jgi:oxygen-independent coproporphyrinogen-3 oxidase
MEYLLSNDPKYFETEELSKLDLYNEYILTSLRTCWGIDRNEILKRFGNNYVKYTEKIAGKFFSKEELIKRDNNICLSDKGIFLADFIIREFFITSDKELN